MLILLDRPIWPLSFFHRIHGSEEAVPIKEEHLMENFIQLDMLVALRWTGMHPRVFDRVTSL